MKTKIGIDIGNVIIGNDTDRPDTFFSEKYLESPAVAGSFDAIAKLGERFGPENLHLVSKCGKNIQRKSLEWLEHTRFHGLTKVPPDHVHFCLRREDKRGICAELRLNMFIDDRWSVLEHLLDLPEMNALFLFAPGASEEAEWRQSQAPGSVRLVQDWRAVLEAIGP